MSDQSTEQSPFAKKGFIFAAIGVGVIALALIIAVVPMLLGGGGKTPPPTAAPTTTAPTVADADKSICGLSGFETESDLTAAPANDWELVGTMAAPIDSEGSGPGVIEADGFRSCYSHTGEGSLFAAVNAVAIGTDGQLRPRMPELVAEGPGKQALEDAINAAGGDADTSVRGQVAGFKLSYGPEQVTVDLAIQLNDGRLVSLPLKMVWEDGDWKLALDAEGNLALGASALQSLGGYIPWSGA
ncbi:hypothetical protein [Agromyces sp. S2-1-8]|uniref:hypothetical protein n=1 Tax=Agromyces sp. S2-1-8 TaxID=2897180 RepID=UPI001E3B637A|nr:hypothetical protein [Agromyces sp. S2-1-8]MCD5348423.1 hypothetical protein [Agromyces sp. S2-1-8]